MPDQEAVIGVIPARYGSKRFPGKPLALIAGKPMIQHVYERACLASSLSDVVVATDDSRIVRVVEGFGGRAIMTSADHMSGTDRVAEVAGQIEAAYYVNIQGDEPLVDPQYIDRCAGMILAGSEMSTLAARIRTRAELFDQNVVKVVLDAAGHALYFSRAAIPFPRKYLDRGIDVDLDSSPYLRHVGVYGYGRALLSRLAEAAPAVPEALESLEQLRALVLGVRIKVAIVECVSLCVDVPEDVAGVEDLMGMGEQG